MAGLPSSEEADEFVSRVDEVSRLIDGLSTGKITPQYVEQKTLRATSVPPTADSDRCQDAVPTAAQDSKQDRVAEDSRRAETMQKVQQIKDNMERKRRARARYEEHVKHTLALAGTDYAKWDLWCPEDEEDELVATCTPDNAQLKAMEKDIDERHQRLVEGRQRAERCRVAGNAAFQQKQWADAYRWYVEGLEAERSNGKLQSNAAMAALKMGCFAQSIEHCDKVVRLYEFLLEKPEDPLVVKALRRRAAARSALGHHQQAVKDLEDALLLEPENADLIQACARARAAKAEQQELQQLDSFKAVQQEDAKRLKGLRAFERLACTLNGGLQQQLAGGSDKENASLSSSDQVPALQVSEQHLMTASPDAVVSMLSDAQELMSQATSTRLYCRACGALAAGSDALQVQLMQEHHDHAMVVALAAFLSEACQLDSNAHALCGDSTGPGGHPGPVTNGVTSAPTKLVSLCEAALQYEAIAVLLQSMSTDKLCRRAITAAMLPAKGGSALCVQMLQQASKLAPVHASIVMALLGNCATEHSFATALARSCDCASACQQLLQQMQQRRNSHAVERAANLLANLALAPAMRQQLAGTDGCAKALAETACCMLASRQSDASSAAQALLSCMFNLAMEPDFRCTLPSTRWCVALDTAINEAQQASSLTALTHCAIAVAARASSDKQVGQQLCTHAAITTKVARIGASAHRSLASQPETPDVPLVRLLGHVVQCLAAWAAVGEVSLLSLTDSIQMLMWACSSPTAPDSCAGNAALCFTYIASSLTDVLRQQGVMKDLVDCAYKRKGTCASRNAAIAAAKLAQDPDCLQQLRDCNGVEIIYSYVKP